jgi:hypothetical protein
MVWHGRNKAFFWGKDNFPQSDMQLNSGLGGSSSSSGARTHSVARGQLQTPGSEHQGSGLRTGSERNLSAAGGLWQHLRRSDDDPNFPSSTLLQPRAQSPLAKHGLPGFPTGTGGQGGGRDEPQFAKVSRTLQIDCAQGQGTSRVTRTQFHCFRRLQKPHPHLLSSEAA